ncbi:MAG: hypothetical protein SF182_20785 [Deltaproteobacteria bacterium]|nr:hypothetical protein [Deltaproteobacteria bacterium]
MAALWIWLTAAAAYAAFRLWYDNWRGRLTAAEVDDFVARLAASPSAEVNDMATLRAFLASDDGREFLMLNLVRLNPEPVPNPRGGAALPAAQAMQVYMREFFPLLVRRAGHPAIAARPIGGYVDAWNVAPDPGWSVVGLMRYRSRRDMALLATDPRFSAAHAFKLAAMPVTFSFPTAPRLTLFVSPRVWVGLLLALAAALAHLGVLLAHG